MSRGHDNSGSRKRKGQKRRLRKRDRGKCFWCREFISQSQAVRDHVVPLRYGGEDTVYNMVYACWDCDQARSHDILTAEEIENLRNIMTLYLLTIEPGWEKVSTRPNSLQLNPL